MSGITAAIRYWRRPDQRFLWWPIRVAVGRERTALSFLDWHGWRVGAEPAPRLPWPWRQVFGQTFHVAWGHLRIKLGRAPEKESP